MSKAIKGITIKLGGDTTGLDKALKGVNDSASKVQKELREVDKLLKFNPQSVELITQKKELLAKQIENTKDKLDKLKEAEKQVQEQFQKGDIGEEQYRAFRREVEETESKLKHFESQLSNVKREQAQLAESTKQLERFFDATGNSIEDFEDVLGTRLVNAIKDGKASARDLDTAFEKIGKSALGSRTDIDKLRNTLKQLDSGGSIDEVRKDLSKLADEANEATEEVEELGVGLEEALAGVAAGVGIGNILEESIDQATLKTKIDVTFDVPEESKEAIRAITGEIGAFGVDAEEALEGVRRQWALNTDATDEQNAAVARNAAALSQLYSDLDFTELIQEGNEIAATLGVTNEEAIALVNSLIKAGFPPGEVDIIAEYGDQLKQAGFSAQEIQGIFAAGVDVKSWSIDSLLDGIKEGRIQLADFGSGLDKSMEELIGKTSISADQFVAWGQAVAGGGAEGQAAMLEATKALAGVEDATIRNQLGTKMFGTMWEDQGTKIIDVILNAEKKTIDLKDAQEEMNETTSKLEDTPAVKMAQAIDKMKIALDPVMTVIADVIAKIAEFAAEHPKITAAFVAIASVIGIIVAAAAALAPVFLVLASGPGALAGISGAFASVAGVISTVAGGIGTAFATVSGVIGTIVSVIGSAIGGIGSVLSTVGSVIAGLVGTISAPVVAIVAAIAAVIAIGVALYKNWDTVKEKAAQLGAFISQTWSDMKADASAAWTEFTTNISNAAESIKTGVGEKFESIKSTVSEKWEGVKAKTSETWSAVQAKVAEHGGGIKGILATSMEGYKATMSAGWSFINTATGGKLGEVASTVRGKFDSIKSAISTSINAARDAVSRAINAIKGFFSGLSLKLPEIKLPRLPKFTITGDFGFNPPRVPKLGIKWNAEGAIFTKPYIFGNQGVGEAGPEAVLPISKLAGIMADTLRKMGMGASSGKRAIMDHTGTITVRGVSDRGEAMDVAEIAVEAVLDKMRREGRAY